MKELKPKLVQSDTPDTFQIVLTEIYFIYRTFQSHKQMIAYYAIENKFKHVFCTHIN